MGRILRERNRNVSIREIVGIEPIEDKLGENRLRWCGHIRRRPIDVTERKNDRIILKRNSRGRGRPKLNWDVVLNLTKHIALDRAEWRKMIQTSIDQDTKLSLVWFSLSSSQLE